MFRCTCFPIIGAVSEDLTMRRLGLGPTLLEPARRMDLVSDKENRIDAS